MDHHIKRGLFIELYCHQYNYYLYNIIIYYLWHDTKRAKTYQKDLLPKIALVGLLFARDCTNKNETAIFSGHISGDKNVNKKVVKSKNFIKYIISSNLM